MNWTDTDKAAIKSRWEGGESASSLAGAFHTTRGAISGLVGRNGWISPNAHGSNQNKKQKRKIHMGTDDRKVSTQTRLKIGGPNWVREVEVNEAEIVFSTADFDAQIPVGQRRSLLGPPHSDYPSRKDSECAWPVGHPREDGFFYCGAATENDLPYCGLHCRAMYSPHSSRSGHLALPKWKTTAKSGW